MAIEAIIFDWYGTLAAPSHEDFWNRMPEIIQGAGGKLQGLTEWEANPLKHEAHSRSEDIYRAWQADRLSTLFQRCGIAEPGRSKLVEELSSVRYQRQFDVFPEVPHALRRLRDRGFRLGVCSNWDWDLERHLHRNEIHYLFDVIACSASVGFRKPHPRIFETVANRIGILPQSMLFVGDSWSDDVEGAMGAGFQPVHIARTGCPVADHLSARCVRDLDGVESLV